MGGGTPHISYHIKGGGDTAHILSYYRWWGHRTYYVYNKIKDRRVMDGWLDGWLDGSMIIVPILAPSCKLKLARFSAKLRIQDGAECGNNWLTIQATVGLTRRNNSFQTLYLFLVFK